MNIETLYDKLYTYAYFKVKNVEVAQDITQETFLRYFSRYGDGKFYNIKLMYKIASNLCVDEYRKQKPIQFEERNKASEDDIDFAIDNLVLNEALSALSSEEKELILLRVVNEESLDTISEIFKCSRFAIYRQIKKTIKKLKNFLEGKQK